MPPTDFGMSLTKKYSPTQYRVFHVSLTFLIWLKMALKYIVDVKARHFYNHKDPPFDMKHQLMSADPVPVVKIDLSGKVYFHHFFLPLLEIVRFVCKTFFSIVLNLKIHYFGLSDM